MLKTEPGAFISETYIIHNALIPHTHNLLKFK